MHNIQEKPFGMVQLTIGEKSQQDLPQISMSDKHLSFDEKQNFVDWFECTRTAEKDQKKISP